MLKIMLKKLFEMGLKVGQSYHIIDKGYAYEINGQITMKNEANNNLKTVFENFNSTDIEFIIDSEKSIVIKDHENKRQIKI